MSKIGINLVLSCSLLLGITVVHADPAKDPLGTCLTDSMTGKDRQLFVREIFMGIGAHPEIRSLANFTPEEKDQTDRQLAALVTRLITVDCKDEAKKAMAQDPMSMRKSFEIVGRYAMADLMQNEQVGQAMTNYVKYLDQEKFSEVTAGK